jgi:MIP family channel proteins
MTELISANNLRGLMAELIATFMFIFMGIGAIGAAVGAGLSLVQPIDTAGLVVIALGHALGMSLGIVVIGRITGGHLNPAITIAAIVSSNIGITRGITYIVGQLAGAALAVYLLDEFVWGIDNLGVQNLGVQTGDGLVIEVILTFFLVFTVFATMFDKRGNAAWAPLAIGLVIFADHLIAVPLTGASMNPARTFGPAIIHGEWTNHWVYWAGPIIGAISAAVIYVLLFGQPSDRDKLGALRISSDE